MVPFGVYLSWERTDACARHYGIDRWEDVQKRLDAIAANCVDTLWVTNMAEADLPRLIAECEKRGIRLIPSMSTIEGRTQRRWHNKGQYYDKVIPRVVQLAGESKTLAGWHWLKYMDNDPRDRTTDPSNRNSNKGIVTAAYDPWQPLLDAMKQLNGCAYPLAEWFDDDRGL